MNTKQAWLSPLANAIRGRRTAEIRRLLDLDPKLVDEPVFLVLAASHGGLPILTVLVGRGADVNRP